MATLADKSPEWLANRKKLLEQKQQRISASTPSATDNSLVNQMRTQQAQGNQHQIDITNQALAGKNTPTSPTTVPQQSYADTGQQSYANTGQQQMPFTGQSPPANPTQPNELSGQGGTVQRDYNREQSTLQRLGLDPNTIMNMDPKKLFEATYTPEELKGIKDYQDILGYENSKATMENTPKPTNTMLAGLEDALRMKSDPAKQNLGVSDMYAKAGLPTSGVSGYTTLMQGLNSQNQIMNDKYDSFRKQLSTTATALSDTYNAVADQYKLHLDDYNRVYDTYQSVLNTTLQAQQQMDLAQQQFDLEQKALQMAKNQPLDPMDQLKLAESGYAYNSETGQIEYQGGPTGTVNYGGIGSYPEDSPQNSALAQVFQPPGKSKYRKSGFECAEAVNLLTDGSHLGSNWEDKISKVTHRKDPSLGNAVVIPIGDQKWGHAAMVISKVDANGNFKTVEWNLHGDGQQTFETRNINDLNNRFGSNWGFTDSQLKKEYKQAYAGLFNYNQTGSKDIKQNFSQLGSALKNPLQGGLNLIQGIQKTMADTTPAWESMNTDQKSLALQWQDVFGDTPSKTELDNLDQYGPAYIWSVYNTKKQQEDEKTAATQQKAAEKEAAKKKSSSRNEYF